jgi:outer membrane biosynthesis protein TonB
MNSDLHNFELKNRLLFFLISLFMQFFIGSTIWKLCSITNKVRDEKTLNISLIMPVGDEIKQELPKDIIHLPELDNNEIIQKEMSVEEIIPDNPFEMPRLMEEPVIPKIEPTPKKKKKEIRKEAPKIVKQEVKEVFEETTKPNEVVEETKPVTITTSVTIEKKQQISTTQPRPVLTKAQINENSKYLSKVMKIFEKNRVYPKNARFSHTEGKIIVSFCIDKNGNTSKVVAKTKEPKILSLAAEELVKKSKLPPPPAHWETSSHIELPITYKLR